MTPSNDTFKLAASYTIGSYILLGEPIDNLSNLIDKKIKVDISTCREIVTDIKEGIYTIGLIESPLFDDALIYKPWMTNEMVFCSKTEIPEALDSKLLKKYQLICREASSLTRVLVGDFFKKFGISHKDFKSIREIDNATAAIQGVKWSKVNLDAPTLAVVPKLAIEEEIERQELFISRYETHSMQHSYYIVYAKKDIEDKNIQKVVTYLLNLQKP